MKQLPIETVIKFTRYFAFQYCAANLEKWAVPNGGYEGPVPPVKSGLLQLAEGLAFIHDHKYFHGAINAKRILISSDGSRLIISDFGLCERSDEETADKDWQAPEQTRADFNLLPVVRKQKADTFSMGCIFVYFLTKGTHPVSTVTWTESKQISEVGYDSLPIITKMIQKKPNDRPEMKDVVKDLDNPVPGAATCHRLDLI